MAVDYMEMVAEGYRNSTDMKERQMFSFYEKTLKPRISTLIRKFKPNGVDKHGRAVGFYYEVWIDLTDYFIPDNYAKLRNLDFEEAAKLCYDYLKSRQGIYFPKNLQT